MVADIPRLSRTGRPAFPTSRRSEKFCMLRAPIWNTSAYSATTSTWDSVITSVTTRKSWRSAAARIIFRPSSPSPWNEYGLDRGLKAPPRRMRAPLAATAAADASIWASVSTEHGPAMTTSSGPPTGTPPTSTTVLAGWPARAANVNGLVTRTTSRTSGSTLTWRTSKSAPTPVAARTTGSPVRWTSKPNRRRASASASTRAGARAGSGRTTRPGMGAGFSVE